MADEPRDTIERLARLETESKHHTSLLSKISETLEKLSRATDQVDRIDKRVSTFDKDLDLFRTEARSGRDSLWKALHAIRQEKDMEHRAYDKHLTAIEGMIESNRATISNLRWTLGAITAIAALVGGWIAGVAF